MAFLDRHDPRCRARAIPKLEGDQVLARFGGGNQPILVN
jgi:hypothetical protein